MAAKVVEAQRRLHYLAGGGSECSSRIDKKTAAEGSGQNKLSSSSRIGGRGGSGATSEVDPVKAKKG